MSLPENFYLELEPKRTKHENWRKFYAFSYEINSPKLSQFLLAFYFFFIFRYEILVLNFGFKILRLMDVTIAYLNCTIYTHYLLRLMIFSMPNLHGKAPLQQNSAIRNFGIKT